MVDNTSASSGSSHLGATPVGRADEISGYRFFGFLIIVFAKTVPNASLIIYLYLVTFHGYL